MINERVARPDLHTAKDETRQPCLAIWTMSFGACSTYWICCTYWRESRSKDVLIRRANVCILSWHTVTAREIVLLCIKVNMDIRSLQDTTYTECHRLVSASPCLKTCVWHTRLTTNSNIKSLICDLCPAAAWNQNKLSACSRMHVTVGAAIDHSQHRTAAS